MALPVELEHVRAVLVGNVERAVGRNRDTLGIEAAVEGVGVADQVRVSFLLQKPRVEQRRRDVWKRRAGIQRDMQEMDAIEVRRVGEAVERPAVGRREKDIVVTGVGNRGSEAAHRGLIDADGVVVAQADWLTSKARQIQRVAGYVTDADQRDAWISRRDRQDEKTGERAGDE